MTIGQLSKHFSEPQSSRAILGEKTPVHTFYWKWILETLYPESCGIVVVRHPVTNISSILKRAPSLSAAEARYLRFSRAVVDLANHPRVTVIKYEDLVESPGSAIESAVRFIGGTEFDPSLRLVSYAKGSYTGDRIDPSRNPKPDETLRREDRARIRRRFDQIYSAFQYD